MESIKMTIALFNILLVLMIRMKFLSPLTENLFFFLGMFG